MLDYDHNCRDDHITGGRAKIILLWQIVLEVKMEMMDSKIHYIIALKKVWLYKKLTRLNFPFRDFLLLHTLTLQNFYNLTLTPFLTEWKKSLQLKLTFLLFASTTHFPPEHSVTQPGFGGEADIGKNQDLNLTGSGVTTWKVNVRQKSINVNLREKKSNIVKELFWHIYLV